MSESAEIDFSELEALDWAGLKAFWQERFDDPPPNGRVIELLRYEIAWRLQVERHGDLDAVSRRLLRQHARAAKSKMAAAPSQMTSGLEVGANLVREWRGRTHHVRVVAEGYLFEGRTYKSLSVIARTITGAKWSGPRFFGLIEGPP
jgi:hypothetical protein